MRKLALLMLVLGVSVLFADVTGAVTAICTTIHSILPLAIFLAIVLAAVVYVAGQMLGAETRARATVWATTLLTGAVIAALIMGLAPPMLSTLGGMDVSATACNITSGGGAQKCPYGECPDGTCRQKIPLPKGGYTYYCPPQISNP